MVALGYSEFAAAQRESKAKEADHRAKWLWRGSPAVGSAATVMAR